MSGEGVAVLVGAVVALVLIVVGLYLAGLARRIDRLHRRVEGARLVLDTQLVRRAHAALEFAATGVVDPAASLAIAEAATAALEAGEARERDHGDDVFARSLLADRVADVERAESDLTRCLRAALGEHTIEDFAGTDAASSWQLANLAVSAQRVQMARKFHNEAVSSVEVIRAKRAVRWLRLAGHAPDPLTVEIDDDPPAVLADPAMLGR